MPNQRRQVRFDIVVRIPSKNTKLRNIASSLHNFGQAIGDFHPGVWDEVDLNSSNGIIVVKVSPTIPRLYHTRAVEHGTDLLLWCTQRGVTFTASNMTIHTTNSPIVGHFVSDSTLYLQTSNGAIFAEVDLINNEERTKTSSATLITTNA